MHTQERSVRALVVSFFAFVLFAAPPAVRAQTTWTTADIGSPQVTGTSVSAPCTTPTLCPAYTITAAGTGISGTADQLTLVYQRLTGDGIITTRVSALSTTTGEAGVMMRESMTAGARQVAVTAGSSIAFKRRTVASGTTATTVRTRPVGAVWLRIERVGSVLTAATSTDGALWTLVGSETLALPSTVYVGIAVSSNAATVPMTATVTNFSLVTTAALPAGWATADIGDAPSMGSASYASGGFTLSSSGLGPSGTADAFRFLYVRVIGDATLIARVAASTGPAGHFAGIALRETLDPAARQIAIAAKDGALVLTQRLTPATSSTIASVGTRLPPVWFKLERRGTSVTASFSADGTTWTARPAVTVGFASEIYAGIFVAGGASRTKAAAAFDGTSLVAAPANLPPSVSITSPASGAKFTQGTSVTIAASASDPDDVVARVEFMVNGTRIASDTAAPFSATWIAGAAASYTLSAKAIDFDGATTTSAAVSVSTLASTSPTTGGTTSPTGSSLRLSFEPAYDYPSITYFAMDVFAAGTRVLVVSTNLGKPPLTSDATCQVDVTTVLAALPAGLYDIVVRAVAPTGSASSAPGSFSK